MVQQRTYKENMLDNGKKAAVCQVEAPTEPPDGGWGWMVVVGVMLVTFLNFGHFRAFGLYIIPMMNTFQATPSQAAWIVSIQGCLFSFLGIVASSLSQLWGPRIVGILGASLACIGMAISSFATNTLFLIISMGLSGGIGMCFSFIPAIQMIGRYFSKRRGFANGLMLAGNAIGGMGFPVIINMLLEEYGIRGTLMCTGAILFNSCVGIALWQPVEWHLQKRAVDVVAPDNAVPPPPPLAKKGQCRGSCKKRQRSDSTGSIVLNSECAVECCDVICEEEEAGGRDRAHSDLVDTIKHNLDNSHVGFDNPVFEGDGTDKFQPGRPETKRRSEATGRDAAKHSKLFDVALLSNPMFWIISVAQMCTMVAHPGTRLFLPYRSEMLGFTGKQSAIVLSANAALDLVGRLVTSWVSDMKCCGPRTRLYMLGAIVSGVFAFLLPYCERFELLVGCAAALGFFTGSFVGLNTTVVGDVFGAERVAMVYSMINIFSGVSGLAGPPLMGYIMETTKSYHACQFVAASLFTFGGFMFLLEPVVRICQR